MYGLGILKGMGITLRNLLRRPITIQYPEEKIPLPLRFRGYEFAWYADRCTVCATCAKACPHGVISIESHVGDRGQWVIDKFQFDIATCMFCGLCVEACPFDALFMGSSFEEARYRRSELIIPVQRYIDEVPPRPSAYYKPWVEEARRRGDEPQVWTAEGRKAGKDNLWKLGWKRDQQ